MNLLYEEGGDIKIATVQSATGTGDSESWQATSLSGKKIKLKAKEVWLRFEKPEAQAAMDEALALSKILTCNCSGIARLKKSLVW